MEFVSNTYIHVTPESWAHPFGTLLWVASLTPIWLFNETSQMMYMEKTCVYSGGTCIVINIDFNKFLTISSQLYGPLLSVIHHRPHHYFIKTNSDLWKCFYNQCALVPVISSFINDKKSNSNIALIKMLLLNITY